MRKLPFFLVGIIAGLSLASLYGASPAQELGKWWKNSRIVTTLGLSGRQIENIERSYLDHRRTLVDLTGTLKSEEDRLKSLMDMDAVDDAAILKQAEMVAEARKELEIAQAAMLLSFRKELTGKQWKKMDAMQELRGSFRELYAAEEDASNAAGRMLFLPDGTEYYVPGKGVQAPVVINMTKPPYTEEAKRAGISGIVLLEAVIHEDGSVDNFKVLRGLGYGLDESAISTIARKWVFQPGMKNGRPVNTKVSIEVSFVLF